MFPTSNGDVPIGGNPRASPELTDWFVDFFYFRVSLRSSLWSMELTLGWMDARRKRNNIGNQVKAQRSLTAVQHSPD